MSEPRCWYQENMSDPRFELGEYMRGYQRVTQLSTGHSKWVKLASLNSAPVDEAFYDASFSHKPGDQ